MKNIHVLPTSQASKLYKVKDKLYFEEYPHKSVNAGNQNIYIINDKEIKFNDFITDGYLVWQWKDNSSLLGRKKVILTTDQDLIADGIEQISEDVLLKIAEHINSGKNIESFNEL